MKLALTSNQQKILECGGFVTVSRTVNVPKTVADRIKVLANYQVKNRSLLTGVVDDGETVPLVVGMVKLNIEDSCIEFDVYDQRQVIL